LLSAEAMLSTLMPSFSMRPERSVTCMTVPMAPMDVVLAVKM